MDCRYQARKTFEYIDTCAQNIGVTCNGNITNGNITCPTGPVGSAGSSVPVGSTVTVGSAALVGSTVTVGSTVPVGSNGPVGSTVSD